MKPLHASPKKYQCKLVINLSGTCTGLEKYLNFTLPWALPCLPKFSNALIIHEHKNGSQTTGTLILTVVRLVLITFMFTYFLGPVLQTGYLRYDTVLSQFVQFVEDRGQVLECSPAKSL